jgi:hypothetical protein
VGGSLCGRFCCRVLIGCQTQKCQLQLHTCPDSDSYIFLTCTFIYVMSTSLSGASNGVSEAMGAVPKKDEIKLGTSKKTNSHDAIPPPRHERSASSSDSPLPLKRSVSRKESNRSRGSDDAYEKGGHDKLSPTTPSKALTSPRRANSISTTIPTIQEEQIGRSNPVRSAGKASDSDSSSPRPLTLNFAALPALPSLPSPSRTPSPRLSSRHSFIESPRATLSPSRRTRVLNRKSSYNERHMSPEILSMKASTTTVVDDMKTLIKQQHEGILRRTVSEAFFASWDYGNLEADFHLPNGNHVSQHYDAMQARRAKQRRKKLRREESKRVPTRDFLLISDLHSKLGVDESKELDVVYDDERRNERELVVVAGTDSKLFSLLADHRVQDKEYIDVYLATHLRFISTLSLFSQLLEHFRNPLALLSQSSGTPLTAAETEEYIPLIQVRIVNVFKKWLRYHYAYEFDDEKIATQMETFIDELTRSSNPEHNQWSLFLRSSWKKRRMTNFDAYEFDTNEAPKVIVPAPLQASNLSFLDIHPTELARQLTIKHQNMFQRVRNNHLLQFLKDKDDPDNPVAEIAAFSAKLTDWVGYELVSTPSVKKRAQVYANFVKLCVTLKNLTNFQGALDIFCGLSHYLVSRLRKTIKAVDSSTKDKLKQLNELFDTAGGLKNLRKHIKSTTAPLIIPASIWLHDLILSNENSDYYQSETGTPRSNTNEPLINFAKLRLFANTFAEVYRCQLEPYNFTSLPMLQEYIGNHFITVPALELEAMFTSIVATQEARKDSISSSASSSSMGSASSGTPPKSPKSGFKASFARKASLSSLFRLKINSPNAKKEPKDISKND